MNTNLSHPCPYGVRINYITPQIRRRGRFRHEFLISVLKIDVQCLLTSSAKKDRWKSSDMLTWFASILYFTTQYLEG